MVTKEEALDRITKVNKLAKQAPANLDLSEPKVLLKKARKSLKKEDWAQAKSHADQAEKKINVIKDVYLSVRGFYESLIKNVEKFEKRSLTLTNFKKKDEKIHKLIENGSFEDAKDEIDKVNDKISEIIGIHDEYLVLDKRLSCLIESNIRILEAESRFDAVRPCFNENKWKEAEKLVEQATSLINEYERNEQARSPQALDLITELYEMIEKAVATLDLNDAMDHYNVAHKLYKSGNFSFAIEKANTGKTIVEKKVAQYTEVYNAIKEAEDLLEIIQGKDYLVFDLPSIQQELDLARNMVMENNFDLALTYTTGIINKLQTLEEDALGDVKEETDTRFKVLWGEIYDLDQAGLNVDKAKTDIITIQKDLKDAWDYREFKRIDTEMNGIETHLEDARAEFALLSNLPGYISHKLDSAKTKIKEAEDDGAEVSELLDLLEGYRDELSRAVTDYELETLKGRLEDLFEKIEEARQKGVEVGNILLGIDEALNSTGETIEELKDDGYDTEKLLFELENKRKMFDKSSSLKSLTVVRDNVMDWKNSIEAIYKIGPDKFNSLGGMQVLLLDIDKLQKELVEENADISRITPKIDFIKKKDLDSRSADELRAIKDSAEDLIAEMEVVLDKARTDSNKHEHAQKEIERWNNEIAPLKGMADLSAVERHLEFMESALRSREFAKALAHIEKAGNEVMRIKNPSSATITVDLHTETMQPNVWDQSKLSLSNTGLVTLKNIDVRIDGPVEIRGVKRIPELVAGEKKNIDVGMMFNGKGRIPIDIKVGAERAFDQEPVSIQEEVWVNIGTTRSTPSPVRTPEVAVQEPKAEATGLKDEVVVKLKQLASLRDEGIISEEDYEKKKDDLLSEL